MELFHAAYNAMRLIYYPLEAQAVARCAAMCGRDRHGDGVGDAGLGVGRDRSEFLLTKPRFDQNCANPGVEKAGSVGV